MLSAAYQKLIIQLNIIEKDYFLKDLLEKASQVKKQAIEGLVTMDEIESMMKFWQSEVILEAQKEAEMLFTDQQLAALAALRRQINETEEKMMELRENLVKLDQQRRDLEKELIDETERNQGSQLLAGAIEGYWQTLIQQRENNVESRYQDLIKFIEELKNKMTAEGETIGDRPGVQTLTA